MNKDTGAQMRHDRALVVGQDARDGVLQALGPRDRDAGIAWVGAEIELRSGIERRRRDVEAAAPDLDLVVAVLGRGLRLVEPGEPAVVALVQAPVLGFGDPQHAGRLERQVQRLDRARLERGERHVGQHALGGEQPAGGARLFLALLGQAHVPPAGEAVFQVPLALAVADEDQTRQGGLPGCLEAVALAFPRLFGKSRLAVGIERFRLRLAAAQVLAQLGGEALVAFGVFIHAMRLGPISAGAQAPVDKAWARGQ